MNEEHPNPKEDGSSRCHGDAGAIQPAASAAYFRPMCEGVKSAVPGDCPKCGMTLEPKELSDDAENSELEDMKSRLWIGAVCATPVFVLAMAHLSPGAPHWPMGTVSRWTQFILTTPVVAWAGGPFFVRGARSIRTGNFNMFTLIALGVGPAYAYSAVAMLAPNVFLASMHTGHGVGIYFEAAAVIIVLVLAGQVMELRARAQTGSATRALLDLAPAWAPERTSPCRAPGSRC